MKRCEEKKIITLSITQVKKAANIDLYKTFQYRRLFYDRPHFMKINIPESDQERIVIVGGGFGGLTLARELKKQNYQIVLIDKHNYHQFQPLFYQVAMSGLEPSSIVFRAKRTSSSG